MAAAGAGAAGGMGGGGGRRRGRHGRRRRLGQSLVGNFTGIGACFRKLISLDQKPDFGVAESILKHAIATPGESPNKPRWPQNWMRFARLEALPCYPLKIANRQEIYHEPPGY